MRSLLACLVIAVVAPAWAQQQPASAEAKTKAREAYRTATQHYDLGEFEEALHDFKEAYRNYEEPTFLFNIGQCHRQLGQKEQAIRFFKVYLSKVPNAPNRVEVKEMIGKLELAFEQERASQTGKPTGTLEPPEKPEAKPEAAKPEAAKPEAAKPEPQPQVVVAPVAVEKAPAETPVYKKWWLWTAVAAVVVVGVGIGLGVGLSSSGSTPSANTDFGTYKPF